MRSALRSPVNSWPMNLIEPDVASSAPEIRLKQVLCQHRWGRSADHFAGLDVERHIVDGNQPPNVLRAVSPQAPRVPAAACCDAADDPPPPATAASVTGTKALQIRQQASRAYCSNSTSNMPNTMISNDRLHPAVSAASPAARS